MELVGDLSWIEVVSHAIGIFGGGFAVWSLIRPAHVELKVADTVDLVIGRDGLISDFHLACSFENHGARIGTVQRMRAEIINPDRESREFGWVAFVGYQPRDPENPYRMQRVPIEDRHAIAIRKNDAEFACVLFRSPRREGFQWVAGEYTFEISIWVNAKKPTSDPQTKSFRAIVPERLAEQIGEPRESTDYWAIEIIDWDPN